MTEVVSVKFQPDGRDYYFDPVGVNYNVNETVIIESADSLGVAYVSAANHLVEDEKVIKPFRKIVRAANEKDKRKIEENRRKEKEALDICEQKVIKHGLDMKLVSAEISFDGSKILFFFTSDGRVDFRDLVKDLAATFHARIELRQIGVRDEAKILGGLGICGQPFCCSRFLDGFQPVSIKMAKAQGLSPNPAKISGSCGRLMCCLKYEQDAYEYLISLTPNVGSLVRTSSGTGTVTEVSLLTGMLTVRLDESEMSPIKVHRDNVELVSRGKKK